MNYFVDWHLIERTKDDFQRIFDKYELHKLKIEVVQDAISLSGLYKISRTQRV
jgi:3-methyladenine DNA glycosylase Tag